jgi:type VI secretion system protein ImpK
MPEMMGIQASDINPLLSAATPLLTLAVQLRNTPSHADPENLFAHISQEITNFEVAARGGGARPEGILASRYVLCTFLDEIVLATPWGNQSGWVSRTLLNAFHNEGWGGEKFYLILDQLLTEPHQNVDLLELFYVCLALGFEGRLRVQAGGRSELDRIQTNLYNVIRSIRGEHESDLSPRWRGVRDLRTPLARYVPLWVVAAVAAGGLALVYFLFLMTLNSHSDPVAVEVAALGRNLQPLVERQAYVVQETASLRDLLAPEIQQGLLEVRDDAGTSTVILKGDGLFASGSGDVNADKMPVLRSISDALQQVPGQVLITGHTDDVPIRSIRFPSNWHLSKRRAEAVRDILASNVDPTRLLAEPRSSNEPLVANTSAANRAQNRRVEVTLFAVPGRE